MEMSNKYYELVPEALIISRYFCWELEPGDSHANYSDNVRSGMTRLHIN